MFQLNGALRNWINDLFGSPTVTGTCQNSGLMLLIWVDGVIYLSGVSPEDVFLESPPTRRYHHLVGRVAANWGGAGEAGAPPGSMSQLGETPPHPPTCQLPLPAPSNALGAPFIKRAAGFPDNENIQMNFQ